MPRLLRPSIPDSAKLAVVLRQLGEMFPGPVLATARKSRTISTTLTNRLCILADLLGCQPGDLHLDHDPPLATRDKVRNRAGEHIGYRPAANDPEFLIYRTAQAHRIKTNVRGDGALHPDRVYIKRARRRERAAKALKKPKGAFLHRGSGKGTPGLKSRSQWPPRGSRKLPSRPFPTKEPRL